MLGVGTDILRISNLGLNSLEAEDSFIRKTYTPAEVEQALQREVPLYYYATRFAGKEAVFKALNVSANHFKPVEIEILADEKGQPNVVLSGFLAQHAQKQGIKRVLVSLSYDTDYVVAYANAVGA